MEDVGCLSPSQKRKDDHLASVLKPQSSTESWYLHGTCLTEMVAGYRAQIYREQINVIKITESRFCMTENLEKLLFIQLFPASCCESPYFQILLFVFVLFPLCPSRACHHPSACQAQQFQQLSHCQVFQATPFQVLS